MNARVNAWVRLKSGSTISVAARAYNRPFTKMASERLTIDLEHEAHRLLGQRDVLRQPSDLDLLIFFARHPRSLLSSEQLALFLGYGVKKIAASLDLLLEAGFLTRTPNPKHAARMYVFAVTPPGGGWLAALTELASTRSGRVALILAIRRRSPTSDGPAHAGAADESTSSTLPFSRRRTESDGDGREPIAAPDATAQRPRKRG